MCVSGGKDPGKPSEGGATAPCCKVKGKPKAVDPKKNSIICRNGQLVVQSNNAGPDQACTIAHENSHIADWKERYGEDLCEGVPDGHLPLGGEGYTEFLRQSECKAYRVGKACREAELKKAAETDKAAIQKRIDRDIASIKKNKCE